MWEVKDIDSLESMMFVQESSRPWDWFCFVGFWYVFTIICFIVVCLHIRVAAGGTFPTWQCPAGFFTKYYLFSYSLKSLCLVSSYELLSLWWISWPWELWQPSWCHTVFCVSVFWLEKCSLITVGSSTLGETDCIISFYIWQLGNREPLAIIF